MVKLPISSNQRLLPGLDASAQESGDCAPGLPGAWSTREPENPAISALWTLAGKTGTSQVVSLGKEAKGKNKRKTEDHAWFVSFAPVENSQIAIAVIIEHGGHGGTAAAPAAREVMREFFLIKAKDSNKS